MIRDLLRYREYRRHKSLLSQSTDRVKIDQVLGLRDLIQRLFAESPFYGDRLRRAGNRPGDLRTVKDLAGMPATSAAEFAGWLRAGDSRAAWAAGARDAHEAREIAAGVAWASMPGSAGGGGSRPGVAPAGGGGSGAAAAAESASADPTRVAGRERATVRERATGDPGGPGGLALSLDSSGRALAHLPEIDAEPRLVQLFALLDLWGFGPRARLAIACGEDFGQAERAGGLLFRAGRAESLAALREPGSGPLLIEPGQLPAALAAGVDAARCVLRGAPIPDGAWREIGLASGAAPRAILGGTLFGPIAWQCAAGSVHAFGARAVIEPATDESVARGLTGGSRASRAPRTAGELHLTLLERAQFPAFRVALGLRGRFAGAGCPCGARSDRIELEIPFLGPLRVAGGAFLDPLPIARAAAASPGARRVAIIQETDERIRVLVAVEERRATDDGRAAAAALSALPLPPGVALVPEVGAERDLPFPERGFVRGLTDGPLLSLGGGMPVDTPESPRVGSTA